MDIRTKNIQQINIISLIANFILASSKIITGIMTSSTSVLGDGVNNLSDIGTTIATIIGFKMSSAESDSKHPYGHERIEFFVGLLMSFGLIATSIGLFYSSVTALIQGTQKIINPDKMIIVMIVSIVIKEFMYHLNHRAAKKYDSSMLRAVAMDSRSDVLSSSAVLIGLVFASFKIYFAEQIVTILIAILILYGAIKIIVDCARQLIDSSAGEEIENKIRERTIKTTEVLSIEGLKTRRFGNRLYVDIDIVVDKNFTFEQAHLISHNVHNLIEDEFSAKHVQVHASPSK